MSAMMYQMVNRVLLIVSLALAGAVALVSPPATNAQAIACPGSQFTITETMANGAVWNMCWSDSANDGVTLWDVRYTPPGGTTRKILHEARLAQVFVPYDDNGARFHDVTDYGMGWVYRVNLQAAECPGGSLLANNGVNVICKTKLTNQPYAYRYRISFDGPETVKMASVLSLSSISQIGQYAYVQKWLFHDDGTLEPSLGATGQLQRCNNDSATGALIGPTSKCTGATPYGASHTHTYYWYLDFDLDGSANDMASEIEAPGPETSYTRTTTRLAFASETARRFAQPGARFWRVRDTAVTNSDGHLISYELGADASHVFYGPEPFTKNDVFFTQRKACERYVSHNIALTGCGTDDVSGFVSGEAISDLVVWYRVSFHHIPHDEDDPYMSIHWNGFQLRPRDMTGTNMR